MIQENKARALEIFQAGIEAADPERAVTRSLSATPLECGKGRLFIVAIGKAALGMARAALGQTDGTECLVVTTPENSGILDGARVVSGAHPNPNTASVAAGQAVLELLGKVRAADHVLALISGGGSSLVVAPVPGLTLADKICVNKLLLASGLDIGDVNLIRQGVSRLKGGGMLTAVAPARVTALILSDVVGDDLQVVASGPTTAPIGSRAQARAVAERAGIWKSFPTAVQRVLSAVDENPQDIKLTGNRLIGSNAHSVAAMARIEPAAIVFPHALEGDVQDAARTITRCKTSGVWLFGGETTVRLTGNGLGGRNQELALRVAFEAARQNWPMGWLFLSGGTDGRDGPTNAAGGIVDGGTLNRIRTAGLDPVALLENNDSYHALQASGDLLITGATGTNVADLQVLIRP